MTDLILHPFIKQKKLETKFLKKYIDVDINININIKTIIYNKTSNINKSIIQSYSEKPDLLIIKFDDKINTFHLTNIPRYPI